MKFIIDIPKEVKAVIDRKGTNEFVDETLWRAVKNGVSLEELSKELTSFREGIKDENVLIGFNMAIAICNKYLGEKK